MKKDIAQTVRENYDRLAEAYARRFCDELQFKPRDRELVTRFANNVRGGGMACDMGCGPGHIARYLRDAGVTVFGLDFSRQMIEQARQMNPDTHFN